MGPFFIFLLIIIVAVVVFAIVLYNSLVQKRNQVKNMWSQIDVELQRRFDLIPNLVESVKGYMNHEEKVLSEIAELRTSWSNAKTINEKANLNNQLSNSLSSFMAIAEGYPDLKASQNFLELQNELQNTENKISNSRQSYNDAVTSYNISLETFPSNLVASTFNFTKEELFKVDDEKVKENVKVSF